MDNEKRIQEILRDAVEKLAKIDNNVAHQVRAIILITRGAITVGDLPDLSRLLMSFAEFKINSYKNDPQNN